VKAVAVKEAGRADEVRTVAIPLQSVAEDDQPFAIGMVQPVEVQKIIVGCGNPFPAVADPVIAQKVGQNGLTVPRNTVKHGRDNNG
jgi:hypothetical protein